MQLGVSTASFFTRSETEDTLNLIQDMGFEICEVFLTTFREYRKDFVDMLRERQRNIRIYSIHTLNQQFEPELFNKWDRTREDAEDFFKEIIYACKRLDADYYTFHGPPRLKRTPYIIDYPWMAKRLNELNAMLAEGGSDAKIAYENVHWTYFNSPEFLIRLSEYVSTPVCLDIKQAMQSKVALDEYIEVMAPTLVNVHLCDWHEDGKLAIPGEGIFDFTGFFRKLNAVGYTGPVLMELYAGNYRDFDDVKRSAEYLQKCLDAAAKG